MTNMAKTTHKHHSQTPDPPGPLISLYAVVLVVVATAVGTLTYVAPHIGMAVIGGLTALTMLTRLVDRRQ